MDLWGKFDPPTLPRGLLPASDRGVRVRPGHDDGLRHGRHCGRRAGGLCRGDPGRRSSFSRRSTTRDGGKRPGFGWRSSATQHHEDPNDERGRQAAASHRQRNGARKSDARWSEYNRLSKEEKQQREPPKADPGHDDGHHDRGGAGNPEGQPDGVLCYQDELSGWFGSMDKYSGARGAAEGPGILAAEHTTAAHTPSTAFTRGLRVSSEHFRFRSSAASSPSRSASLPRTATTTGFCSGSFRSCCARPWSAGTRPSGRSVFDYNALISKLRELRPPTGGRPAASPP